jgi:hypothetical protein
MATWEAVKASRNRGDPSFLDDLSKRKLSESWTALKGSG